MKSPITALTLVVISLFTATTSAQDIAPQDGSPMGKDMDKQLSEMQNDMNAMLQQIAKLRQQSQLQKNINVMQRQIEDLQSTTDPKERQNLLQAHVQTLQEHMKMVQSMSEAESGFGQQNEKCASRSRPAWKNDLWPRPNRLPGRDVVWSRHDERSAGLHRRDDRSGQTGGQSSWRHGHTEV